MYTRTISLLWFDVTPNKGLGNIADISQQLVPAAALANFFQHSILFSARRESKRACFEQGFFRECNAYWHIFVMKFTDLSPQTPNAPPHVKNTPSQMPKDTKYTISKNTPIKTSKPILVYAVLSQNYGLLGILFAGPKIVLTYRNDKYQVHICLRT